MTKSKTTKKALLSSVLALVLCFTMLLGTTFAWFTDTASTSVNTIQAGTLDIELLDANGNSLEGETLSWQKDEGASENEAVLWEPGCTYNLQPITIKNNGNLALKYKVVIAGIDGSAKLNEVIDWTINGVETGKDQSLAVGADVTLTISGHMQESAGNEYQGETIEGVAITVYATQDTVEYDSTTNQYDKNATYDEAWDGTTSAVEKGNDGAYHISTAAQFAWVMEQSQNTSLASIYASDKFVLDANIDFGGATITGFSNENVKFGGSFDGQGYTVSNFVINRSDKEDYAGLFNYYSYGTIENLNVKNATVIGQSKVGALLGSIDDGATVKNCTVENCTVIADRKVGGAVGYAQGAAVNNITVKNTTVYCGTAEQAYGKDQWGQVIGYKNTDLTESGNIAGEDVVVKTGVAYTAVSTSEALTAALKSTSEIINITLAGNVTVDVDAGTQWTNAFGGTETKTITIDGQGKYTLTFNYTDSDWSHVATNGAKLILKNLNLTNSGNNTGPWNRHDIVFDCAVELENVSSDKAIALCGTATLKNVKISDNSGEVYGLWITADGQTVTLNNVEINANRAIAIKDQYCDNPVRVTLNITDSKFTSAKKAAVLVTSTAGADITASNVDITGVAADSTNLVWVDNGAGYSNISDVTVTGCTAIVEP